MQHTRIAIQLLCAVVYLIEHSVENVSIRVAARPLAPLEAGDTTGQLEYLSTSTRYADPSWWKKCAQMCWKGYSDWIGVIDGMEVERVRCCCMLGTFLSWP